MSSLDALERWMQGVILHPDGVEAGVTAEADPSGVTLETLDDVVTPGPRLTAAERIGVYANMIRLRFRESMDDDFQGVRALVGEERFGELCRDYLAARPSRSHRLGGLGAAFAAWLRDEATDLDSRAFAVELAEVERSILELYEAPDAEPLEVDALMAIPKERWADVRFELAPAVALFACAYPTNRYLAAVFAGEQPALPTAEASYVCVHRTSWRVRRSDLTLAEYELLGALRGGATLGEALAGVLTLDDVDAEALVANLESNFRDWTAKQLFAAARVD